MKILPVTKCSYLLLKKCVLCRTKQAPTKTFIPTWSKSWSPLWQNLASQHQRNWALTSCKRSRWDCTTTWIMDYTLLLASSENIFFPLSSGTSIHQEMSSPGSLLSNMSILLIKSMLSCCVQNGGPNKETSNLVMCVCVCVCFVFVFFSCFFLLQPWIFISVFFYSSFLLIFLLLHWHSLQGNLNGLQLSLMSWVMPFAFPAVTGETVFSWKRSVMRVHSVLCL